MYPPPGFWGPPYPGMYHGMKKDDRKDFEDDEETEEEEENSSSANDSDGNPTNQDGMKRFGCNICGKGFARKRELEGHVRIHTGEKPYQCPLCQRSYRTQSAMKSHQVLHTDPRFQCAVCMKKFHKKISSIDI